MVFDFIPIILIIFSLAIIIVIIIRRLPDLKSLDISSIIEERESEVKKRIVAERLARKTDELRAKISPLTKRFLKILETIIKKAYFKILELEQSYKDKEPELKKELASIKDKETDLLAVGQKYQKAKNFVEAEKIYLELISLNKKNLHAYQGLGEVYLEKKDYDQAIETFVYLTKNLKAKKELSNGDKHLLAVSFFDLAQIHKYLEKLDRAKKYLEQALELEPNNPRYLDLMVEICIILKDKIRALGYLKKLKKVNPDNVKIKEFATKIKEI